MQATDLVHEAYHRLVDADGGDSAKWNSTGHFFGAAAEAMRRILIERARAKAALKRGGDLQRVEFEELEHPAAKRPERFLGDRQLSHRAVSVQRVGFAPPSSVPAGETIVT